MWSILRIQLVNLKSHSGCTIQDALSCLLFLLFGAHIHPSSSFIDSFWLNQCRHWCQNRAILPSITTVALIEITFWYFIRYLSLRITFSSLCSPEEGADPDSIEKVALQVLSITLPVNKTTLDKMIMQIKDSLSNLTNIEGIINQTSQHVSKAKELLDKAKDAKYVKKLTHFPTSHYACCQKDQSCQLTLLSN